MHTRDVEEGIQRLDRTEGWLIALVIALCAVPSYMLIWMFHVFFQVALVPLAYIALGVGVVFLVVKACMFVVRIKRKLEQVERSK
jgi:membrane protein implicated in regulation of membrane protease activity